MEHMSSRKLGKLPGVAALAVALTTPALAGPESTPWVEGHNNKSRLIAAGSPAQGKPAFAGFEISMPPGWKTYWRNPGDAGVPPAFDWSGSENVETVRVLYPVPHRYTDKSGTVIGYKDHVLLPVEVVAKDPSKPVHLKLKAEYGVCKDICVPAEATMSIETAPGAAMSADVESALATVPQTSARKGLDPVLTHWTLESSGPAPLLKLEVEDPGGSGGDAFLDAPGGLYVPMPVKTGETGGKTLYQVELSGGVDFAALKGQTLTLTLSGAKGQSETTITLK